jgi:hypothetical protein
LAISITKGFSKGIYGVLYKSPQEKNEDFLNSFEEYFELLLRTNSNVYLFGDFNVDYMNDSDTKNELETIANTFEIKQIVSQITRETDRSKTLIDLVFTNDLNCECNVNDLQNISDHNVIELSLKSGKKDNEKKNNLKEIICWSNYSREKLIELLYEVDWALIHNCDINDKTQCLTYFIEMCLSNLLFVKKN